MAGKGNTTQLNMGGTIGTRNIGDYTTRQISTNISRMNYRAQVVSDQRLQTFREAVYKLVSNWAREDKLMILSEYGDAGLLGKHPGNVSNEVLNRTVTESLIVHLDPKDLQQLYNDVGATRIALKKDIRRIGSRTRARNKSAFNIKNFGEAFDKVKDAKNAKSYKKLRKKVDKRFRVPKYITRLYKGLRKELYEVLTECFNVIEITRIAASMDIDIEDGMKPKVLKNEIINKVCLYVDLVTGKSKRSMPLSNAYMDPAPFEEILKYTSYSYVTGKPGLDPNAWAQLRQQAKQAKAQIKTLSNIKNIRKNGIIDSSNVSGKTARTTGGLVKQLRHGGDVGLLKDYSFDQLTALAARYGIDASKFRDIDKLKAKMYVAMARETSMLTKTLKKAGVDSVEDYATVNVKRIKTDPVTGKPIMKPDGTPETENVKRQVLDADGKPKLDDDGNPIYENMTQEVYRGINTLFEKRRYKKRTSALDTLSALNEYGNVLDEEDPKDINTIDTMEVLYKIAEYTNVLSGARFGEKHLIPTIKKTSELGDLGVDTAVPVYVVNTLMNSKVNDKISGGTTLSSVDREKSVGEYTEGINSKVNDKIFGGTTLSSVDRAKSVGEYTEGIGKNVDWTKKYLEFFGLPATKGNNIIPITKDTATIKDEASNMGYKVTSKIFNKSTNKDKQYKVTTADLEWAIKNNYQFATGAHSFIVGDSLTERANPELVTVRGDGSFSVNPLKASPENNYSKFALDAYATGGNGNISSNDMNNILQVAPKAGRSMTKIQKKLDEELAFVNAKNSLSNVASTLGLDPAQFGIMDAKKPDHLPRIAKRIFKAYKAKLKRNGEDKDPSNETSAISSDAAAMGIKKIDKGAAQPVYVVNNTLGTGVNGILSNMKSGMEDMTGIISANFSTLLTGLGGPWAMTAPMGVGAITNPVLMGTGIANTIAGTAMDAITMGKDLMGEALGMSSGGSIIKANTGARIKNKNDLNRRINKTTSGITKFASGGTNVITGDAAGADIFANGAKPELVQSTGDMTITPLNKSGSEQKHKVDRMTTSERRSALAVALSSHVIKCNYKVPESATDITNAGEAIKVFNVKPGITDIIDVGGEQTTLADMIAGIAAQLMTIAGSTESANMLLGAIASKPTGNSEMGSSSSDIGGSSIGFPSSLDSLLGGN